MSAVLWGVLKVIGIIFGGAMLWGALSAILQRLGLLPWRNPPPTWPLWLVWAGLVLWWVS